jgi:hypothetical protein
MTGRPEVCTVALTTLFLLSAAFLVPASVDAQVRGVNPPPLQVAPPAQNRPAPQQPFVRPNVPPAGVPAPAAAVPKIEQLTAQQFDALPNDGLIEVKGERLTKAQIKTRVEQQRAGVRASLAAGHARSEFETVRAGFLKKQKDELEARNAKLRAEVEAAASIVPTKAPAGATLR